jgi:hypothetical protein
MSNPTFAAGSRAPREAKNLLKKKKQPNPPSSISLRLAAEEPFPSSPSSSIALESMPPTPSPKLLALSVAKLQDPGEWTGAWDDSNDWERGQENPQYLDKRNLAPAGEWTGAHLPISVNP